MHPPAHITDTTIRLLCEAAIELRLDAELDWVGGTVKRVCIIVPSTEALVVHQPPLLQWYTLSHVRATPRAPLDLWLAPGGHRQEPELGMNRRRFRNTSHSHSEVGLLRDTAVLVTRE